MNPREKGFLLLTSCLGNPDRRPLTVAQFRELTHRMAASEKPSVSRELCPSDLTAIGCSFAAAQRIVALLSETELLERYLQKGKKQQCVPITRISEGYPGRIRRRIGTDAPAVFWAKGDLNLLQTPAIALVGSRELPEENHQFAYEVGKQAALQGFTLISGNARGADRIAQSSCLDHGGKVISVIADKLANQEKAENILYLSEDGYDLPFSAYRALKRNHVIHALGNRTFVACCRMGKGGTWEGTVHNLRHGYSPVFCYADGSTASIELRQLGAQLIAPTDLLDIHSLQSDIVRFIDL